MHTHSHIPTCDVCACTHTHAHTHTRTHVVELEEGEPVEGAPQWTRGTRSEVVKMETKDKTVHFIVFF